MRKGNSHHHQKMTVLNVIRRDRTALTGILACILILAMGSVRPDRHKGIYPSRFWANKIQWRHHADAVVTGDSRALGGVSPGQMEQILKDRRIVNFGFASNLYVPEYLDAVYQILDPQSDHKTIILGITPHSLVNDPENIGHFFQMRSLTKQELFMDDHFGAFFSFFEYMSFHDAKIGMFPSMAKGVTQKEYFIDGWLATSRKPPGKKKEVKKYQAIYQKMQVSQKVIDNLLDYVSRWSKSGVTVYGFQVPTCKEMVQLEDEKSGFKKVEFISAFEKSGGTWIEIDGTAYDSFDGSHLQRGSAVILSKDLACKILDFEQKARGVSRAE
jgi:hypothetical protein